MYILSLSVYTGFPFFSSPVAVFLVTINISPFSSVSGFITLALSINSSLVFGFHANDAFTVLFCSSWFSDILNPK